MHCRRCPHLLQHLLPQVRRRPLPLQRLADFGHAVAQRLGTRLGLAQLAGQALGGGGPRARLGLRLGGARSGQGGLALGAQRVAVSFGALQRRLPQGTSEWQEWFEHCCGVVNNA